MQHTNVYGIDIETDTSTDGLDPSVAPVRAVALSHRGGDELFVGDEADLLTALDERLARLPRGVIATWNGAAFDLPFLADRATILEIPLGLRLVLDRRLTLQRAPLPGHAGAYRAAWHGHGHLDTYRLYGAHRGPGPFTSLRTIGRLIGLGTVDCRPARNQDLTNEALHAHAPSDARLARVLAERRWPAAARLVDHLDAAEPQPTLPVNRRIARHGAPAVATA